MSQGQPPKRRAFRWRRSRRLASSHGHARVARVGPVSCMRGQTRRRRALQSPSRRFRRPHTALGERSTAATEPSFGASRAVVAAAAWTVSVCDGSRMRRVDGGFVEQGKPANHQQLAETIACSDGSILSSIGSDIGADPQRRQSGSVHRCVRLVELALRQVEAMLQARPLAR